MKTKDTVTILSVFIVGILLIGGAIYWMVGGETASTITGQVIGEDGQPVAKWENKYVPLNLYVQDKYTTGDVDATIKVYSEKPADWGNPRGDFDDKTLYNEYTASSGVASIDKETPAMYYVVLTYTGYNTDFITIEIPDGSQYPDISITDYKSQPDIVIADMTQVGNTTDKDFTFTLVNSTGVTTETETVLLKVAEDTEFRGWKVIVDDEEGFSTDSDGDGTYDEGIKKFTINVGGIEKTFFDPSRTVDEFDSNDEYTFLLNDIVVANKNNLEVTVEIDAITGDYNATNDEVWGEGEGVLSYIKIYDNEGNLFATVDVTA